MLCQLCYTHHPEVQFNAIPAVGAVARQKGLEPLTHGLEGRCSIHLSYWRDRGEPI